MQEWINFIFLVLNSYQMFELLMLIIQTFAARMKSCNRVFKVILNTNKNRMQVYDGKKYLLNEIFKFIFSNKL